MKKLITLLVCLLALTLAPVVAAGPDLQTKTVTIAAGASLSAALNVNDMTLVQVVMPATWDTANLTFQSCTSSTVCANLYDAAGTEVSVTAAAARAIRLSPLDFTSMKFLKVRSGTAASAVNQTAARSITLVFRPQ